ncbi:Uncharacterised protein [Enterobacter hormaechei]|nr:Uncharacterised protein [Enterobacter hormaechei]
MLLERRIFDVVHLRIHFHQLHILKLRVEVLHFLARVIDSVPFELGRFQGLAGRHRLVQVRAGGVYFLGEQERGVDTGAGQLAGIVIGRDVQVVLLGHHFDTAFTILNVHGPFDVRAAVVLQPQIDWNCHVNYSVTLLSAPSSCDDAWVLPGA